ncbi:39S ribosomal protein L47, mitochondrial [Bombyx mandarina]|uniref:Large ribosomal subunit protein uL29m n=2 Tax=Bombyx TaxID=7090 RepID=A0A8R2AQS3_BOMMO|nr:39S ribosomal protein L47, mitochondrial [Bombyx mori]XP_028030252.1 39S ribosomal protein L47, mitochondrial [Bombyx mandarina]
MNTVIIKNIFRSTTTLCMRSQKSINTAAACIVKRDFHTTKPTQDLMEFFDAKKNWPETNIRVGRAWKLDELRLKSNTDLHKLWYVLLKERNMLYTMEHECNERVRLFPNPERIDKVEESMNNIESVIRERNIAYYKLETGETGERPVKDVINLIGMPEKYQPSEYDTPKFMNTRWVRPYLKHGFINSLAVKKFRRLYNEKIHSEVRKAHNRDFNHVQHLLKRFPNLDMDTLKAEYPNVDIEKAKRTKKSRGHFMPTY